MVEKAEPMPGKTPITTPGARILVTGARGFLGAHVCCQLKNAGIKTIRLSRPKPDQIDNETHIGLDMVRDDLAACLADHAPDAIIHCAGRIGEPVSVAEQAQQMRANYTATARLIDAAKTMPVRPKLLLVSSAAIYAPMRQGQTLIDEDHPWQPSGHYGISKTAAAMLGQTEIMRGEMPVIIAVPFNIIGPDQSTAMLPLAFINQLRANPDLLKVGDLSAARDYIDVRDVATALVALLAANVPSGVYNIATGIGTTTGDLLASICALSGYAPEISADRARTSQGPVQQSIGDIAKIMRYSDWRPEYSLNDTLAEMLGKTP